MFFDPVTLNGRAMDRAILRRAGWARVALVLLVLAAILPRILVPLGYMPDAKRGMTLTLCTGMGLAEITVDTRVAGHDREGRGGNILHEPCMFAGALVPILSGTPPLLLAQAVAYVIRHGLAADMSAPAHPGLYLRPPLRGPPLA